MTVCAVETCGPVLGVALSWANEGGEAQAAEASLDIGLQHSAHLPSLLEMLRDNIGLAWRDVDLFAVTAGPGSFTGLRIGMALAKGLASAYGRPIVAVPTAWVLSAGSPEPVLTVLDARKGRYYVGGRRKDGNLVADLDLNPGAATDLAADIAVSGSLLVTGPGAPQLMPHLSGDAVLDPSWRRGRAGDLARIAPEAMRQLGALGAAEGPRYVRAPAIGPDRSSGA